MRAYQRILLVALLAAVFVAAGAAAVRIYLSPLADQAARAPRQAGEMEDDLPPACRDELAAMDNAPAAGPSSAAAADALHEFEECRSRQCASPGNRACGGRSGASIRGGEQLPGPGKIARRQRRRRAADRTVRLPGRPYRGPNRPNGTHRQGGR